MMNTMGSYFGAVSDNADMDLAALLLDVALIG